MMHTRKLCRIPTDNQLDKIVYAKSVLPKHHCLSVEMQHLLLASCLNSFLVTGF